MNNDFPLTSAQNKSNTSSSSVVVAVAPRAESAIKNILKWCQSKTKEYEVRLKCVVDFP